MHPSTTPLRGRRPAPIRAESFAPLGAVSCAVGSATAGRDRHFFDAGGLDAPSGAEAEIRTAAVASTPLVAAARVEFVSLSFVALVCGLNGRELYWRLPKPWRLGVGEHGPAMICRVERLSELVAELSTGGQPEAASKLLHWLTGVQPGQDRDQRKLPWWQRGAMA